jgi:multiple sugar transport system permease protein
MTSQSSTIETIRNTPVALARRKPIRWSDIFSYLILTIAAILVALPLLWTFSTSLRPMSEAYDLPPQWLPTSFKFENYAAPFESNVPFANLFVNSLKITVAVTLGQLVTCSLAGYAFARLRFPGSNVLFILLLASLMVPTQVTIIPNFLTMRSLRLIDNHLAIILPGLVSAFGVFMMRQFFKTLPQDLFDAARVDGAGHLRVFFQIALPLSGASLATLGIITFNATWNSYFLPLIFLNTWDNMTLPQGIALLTGYMNSGNASVVMAAVTMAIIPVLIVFIVAQRWIVEAISRSGIRG